MRLAWLGASSALVLCVVACSSSPTSSPSTEKSGSTSEAIQDGTTDTTDTFAVGVCVGITGNAGNPCQAYCSGALITPNLVVLARHCVSQLSSEQVDCSTNPAFGGLLTSASDIGVTTGSSMFVGSSGYHRAQQIVVPTDPHICGNDLSMLILDDIVSSSEATPIIPGVQYPMDKAGYANSFTAIGYGATSPAEQGVGTRRIRSGIQVLCIPGSALDCPGAGVPDNEFVGGDGTCSGDSGSSAYETNSFKAGKPVSFGVLSRGGVSDDQTMCIESIYTRLDKWRDLVVNTANAASQNWTLYPKPSPDWTIFVPPDTTPDGGSTTPPPGTTPDGGNCTKSSDCAGNSCVDPGNGGALVCATACTGDDQCGSGLTCQEGFCFARPPTSTGLQATPGGTTTTTSGCAIAAGSTGSGASSGLAWLGLGVLGLAAARRRRK